jgi:membrane protease YdiL (CAAX protease family)
MVLDANVKGDYSSIAIIMIISALIPFVLLTKSGLGQLGLTKPKSFFRLIFAFISGLLFSLLLCYLGKLLWGNTYSNWYEYIGKSYNIPMEMARHDKTILFSITALTGMIFSPIGEELFFRGIVHLSFAKSIGETKASIVDGSAFAMTHISHFGLVYVNRQWNFLIIPTLIWVLSMFSASVMFFVFKRYSSSISGAMICHAGFNFGMIYSIFYLL